MHPFSRYGLLSTALLAMTLLAISLGQRLGNRPASPQSINDWSTRELADHLNRAGLQVRLQSTRSDGALGQTAFLTTTDKDWEDLNRLNKEPSRFQQWRGIVHCQRVGRESEIVPDSCGDHYLVAEPFVFYGDSELLNRIDAILAPSDSPAAP